MGGGILHEWEVIDKLGGGGQSDVFRARRPDRVSARTQSIDKIHSYDPWGTNAADAMFKRTGEFADAVIQYARPDFPWELGALKRFKVRDDEEQAMARLAREIQVLQKGRPGLPQLLDSNVNGKWMVTEFFPFGTLESNFGKYKGNVYFALKAFSSLVKTVANLHAEKIVHRDIKPANVFIRSDQELVLGDFGIVYVPDQPLRLTRTNETVGPHDYMPPWADVGERLEEVHNSFDIYMLGKLLWCMVSGRLRLQREWFSRPEYDLTAMFRENPHMYMINTILSHCLVEEQRQCKISASDLSMMVESYLSVIERGGQMLKEGVPRPCHVCGYGFYQPMDKPVSLQLWYTQNSPTPFPFQLFVCDKCGNVEFFGLSSPRVK